MTNIFSLIGEALLLIIVFVIFRAGWKWNVRKNIIEKIEGPKGHLLAGNFPIFTFFLNSEETMQPNVLLYYFCLGQNEVYENAKLLRFWLSLKPYILILNAEAAEVLLSSSKELSKTFEYGFLHDWLGTGLLTSTGSKWRSRRKMLTPTFHFRILDNFQAIFNEQSLLFVEKMKQLFQKEQVVDITPHVTALTLDIICETAMGTKIEAQKNSDSAYVTALQIVGNIFMDRVLRPWIWPTCFFRISPKGRLFYRNLKTLHDFTNQVIQERKGLLTNQEGNSEQELGNRLVFLDILLREQKEYGLTDLDIREEVDTFMFEGHDTTSTGICWALYLLGLHKDVQIKVQNELESIFGGNVESPITPQDLKEMKYLECVLKESQRLYPSVPFIGRELKEDLTIGGKLVPAGTTCVVFPPGIHRNRKVFPNPEKFDPNRFLPENSVGRHPYAFVPFSAGPRNCIGQRFALNEEKTVVAQCLRHFNIRSLEHRDKIVVSPELVTRPNCPLLMTFEAR